MMRLLEKSESGVTKIIAKLGSATEPARELTYRLHHTCERKKYAKEAQGYNALVQSRPEISHLVRNINTSQKSLSVGDETT